MHAQGETDLSLDHAVDEQAQHRQPRYGRDPFGFLQPHGGDCRRILDPTKTRFHRGLLVLIGLENVGSSTDRSVDRGGQHRPPIVLFSLGQGLDLNHEAIARLYWRWGHLRRPAPTGAARAAGLCHAVIADRLIPPGAWAAASSSRPPALILRDGGFGIRLTGKPPGLYLLDVRRDGFGFLLLGGGISLCLLRRQLARMHHETAQCCLRQPPIAILDLYRPDAALPMPLAARFVLGPPRLFHEEGQGGLLLSPGFQLLAHCTGAWHKGHQAQPFFQTPAYRPSTICLA